MSTLIEKQMTLSSKQKDIIAQGDWLNDTHMDHFNQLLKNCSDYRPEGTWKVQCSQYIEPIPENEKHIQILFSSNNHWVCSYYDRKKLFIYDSLNMKKLHSDHEKFLKRLFPTYPFDKRLVKFPTVQHQPNCNDCGVFAIAFAISLLFNIKPEKVRYDHSLMRSHLIKIFESNMIEHFPQDLNYDAPQKVLSLVIIKEREAVATRVRLTRQKKTEQQKANQLQKNREFKKELGKKNENEHESQEERFQYKQNVENICALKRRQYDENNLEENRAKRLRLYKNNDSKKYRTEKRQNENDLENNRAKKRMQYEVDFVRQRTQQRICYAITSQNEQSRQKILERKCHNNERKEERKKDKSMKFVINKCNVAKNIIKKYRNFRCQNSIKLHSSLTIIIKNIAKKLNIAGQIEKQLEAEKIMRWCMHITHTALKGCKHIAE